MIKLVVFDFDETLCLNEEACFYIENEVAQQMGFKPVSREIHKQTWGRPDIDIFEARFPGINHETFMNNLSLAIKKASAEEKLDVISDTNRQVLAKLKKSNKHLAVLTSRGTLEVEHLIDQNHHINMWIEKIYHKGNSKYHKPDPRVFEQILTDFGVTPSETVYVGDLETDGQSAKGAGIHFIALLESGLRTKEDFKDIPVDYFAQTFSDIVGYIESN